MEAISLYNSVNILWIYRETFRFDNFMLKRCIKFTILLYKSQLNENDPRVTSF